MSTTDPNQRVKGAFPTTQWSLILNMRFGSESETRDALEQLCRQYWYPLYSFVRHHGRSHHEAEDCVQSLFAQLLTNDGMACAHPERGRFRSFLMASMRNFLINEWRNGQAEKRGGGVDIIKLEAGEAEQRFNLEPKDTSLTPEQAYDRNWALELINQVMAEIRSEYVASGRPSLFDTLGPLLLSGERETSLAGPASSLGMSPHALSVVLHRLRRRLGENLRSAVAETVTDPADVKAELAHLISALR